MEPEEFNDWYKKGFEGLNEAPPDEVWNGISNQLDMEDVWVSVNARLAVIDRRKKNTRRILYSFALLLVLGGAGALLFPSDDSQNKGSYSGNNGIAHEKGKINEQHGGIVSTDNRQKNVDSYKNGVLLGPGTNVLSDDSYFTTKLKPISEGNPGSNNPEVIPYLIKPEKISDSVYTGDLFPVLPLPITFITVQRNDTSFHPIPAVTGTSPDPLEKTEKTGPLTGFYLGGIYSFKNTWLLNNATLRALGSRTLDQANLHFGHAYGVSAGYCLSSQLSTELNWYINSQQGQTYHVYNEGTYTEKQIKLRFMMFNASIKRNAPYRAIKNNVYTSGGLIAGANFAFLKKGNDALVETYSKSDFGLRFGYVCNIVLNKHFLLSPAIIADIGLKNIYKGNSLSPSSFNRTYNASVGFDLGLKYVY
ncbi:MAG: hypothetical protein AB1458_05395 [Bacteroidota bacterium]